MLSDKYNEVTEVEIDSVMKRKHSKYMWAYLVTFQLLNYDARVSQME